MKFGTPFLNKFAAKMI